MIAYLVSHNGLGDNLYMIGALHYLLLFYDKLFFLCKDIYLENVRLFFMDIPNIHCVPFDSKNEFSAIKDIMNEKNRDLNCDIFICGPCHKEYLQSKITNISFLNRIPIANKPYTIDFDSLNSENYQFIEHFYKDIGLSLTHYFDYFTLPNTEESIQLYNSIRDFYIIFIQLKSSTGESLDISLLIRKYINDDNVILICNDQNLYNFENRNQIQEKKYELCQSFVYNKIVYYIDTIKNSDEIYIIDSCFIGILLPFLKKKLLKTNKVRIILRNLVNQTII
jgi:hypothetical protein